MISVSNLYALVKQYDKDFTPGKAVASELLNPDGTPKVLYHQTGNDFTVFDLNREGAGTYDDETPIGIFLKDSDSDTQTDERRQKMKLPSWGGYWVWDSEKETIIIHCKDGKILDIRETQVVEFTLGNVCSDEWIIADETNTPILGGEATFNFGEAIKYLKRGFSVARKGWNGKGQHIELASNISYANAGGTIVNADHEAIGNKAIAFVGTSGIQLGWLASQADMLAEDWIFAD